MKKSILIKALIVSAVFATNAQVYAASSVDIDALKEEIKQDIKAERPWQDEIKSWHIDIHGFVSQGYLCSSEYNVLAYDSKGGSFQFNEIGINFGADLTDRLHIGIQFLARDLGDLYNDDPEIDWAYADYHWKDWLGLRAGILKVPNGLYNETRDVDMLRTFLLLPSSVYSERNREFYKSIAGVGIYGVAPLWAVGYLDYQAKIGTLNIDAQDSGIAKDFESRLHALFNTFPYSLAGYTDFDFTDYDVGDVYAGGLQWDSPWGLRLGGTYNLTSIVATGSLSPTGEEGEWDFHKIRTYTLSAEYSWRDLILATEFWSLRLDSTYTLGALPSVSNSNTIEGYYFSAAYRLNELIELGTYYSLYYENKDDHQGHTVIGFPNHHAWSKDLTLSTRFNLNQYWSTKLEIHRINGTFTVLGSENDYSFPDQRWWLFAAKVTFSF